MPVRTVLSILAVAVLAATAACTERTPGPTDSSRANQIAALATTREIMLAITIPASDVVFQVGEQPPSDEAAWEKVQANAMALAESANLLKIGARAVDQGDWITHSNALVDAARAAAQAAQEKDVDKVLEVGNRIYEVCDTCHQKYMAVRGGV